jgi:hypothetical protein
MTSNMPKPLNATVKVIGSIVPPKNMPNVQGNRGADRGRSLLFGLRLAEGLGSNECCSRCEHGNCTGVVCNFFSKLVYLLSER